MGNDQDFMNQIYGLMATGREKNLKDIIDEKMLEYDITQHRLAKMLSISKSTFGRIVKNIETGDVESIDFYSVLKIAQFLNISVDDISQFYVSAMKPELIGELEMARTASYLHSNFDLRGLKDVGFIDDIYDVRSIESRITTFFGLSTIYEYKNAIGAIAFSKTKRPSHDKMLEFWVRCAYFQFEKFKNPNEYDPEKLDALIPKMRAYTRYEENGFLSVCKALYLAGITVIVQKYLSKSQVRGATLIVDNKPCIVVTTFNDNYATLWFALLHELYHAKWDFEQLKVWKWHLSDESIVNMDANLFDEEMANHFARTMLFSDEKLNYIESMIDVSGIVAEYAKKNEVHPSIVYNFYCYDQAKKGRNLYAKYSHFFGKAEKATKLMKISPTESITVLEDLEKLKQVLEQ